MEFQASCKNMHWIAWNDICRPKEKGGLGFRSLFDVSKTLLLCYGGYSELGRLYGPTLFGISTAKK